MDLSKIDRNFDLTFKAPEDLEWFPVREEPFRTYGIFYSEEEGQYRRMPKGIADSVNPGVACLSLHTAGGRLRFRTDSPYVAIRVKEPFEQISSNMTICGLFGFTFFHGKVYGGSYMPTYRQIYGADPESGGNGELIFDGIAHAVGENGHAYDATIYFPLYAGVRELYVGLKKGCTLDRPTPYAHEKPVLFLGSSITQGGCASKPGDDYVNILSRRLDTDILNLGFSGSCLGERNMAEYVASFDPSVFVLDYDHNAPDAEHLKRTHFELYRTVRDAHRDTPIILMTMPTIEGYEARPWNKARREVILESYETAKRSGDRNVHLVDCYGCFGKLEDGECGTVDDCHPNSLGFLRMANRVCPVLEGLLK